MELIRIPSIPDKTSDLMMEYISNFTVGLSALKTDGNKINSSLIGTGTLVTINGFYCILTADHVLYELQKSDALNLLISFDGDQILYKFDIGYLNICRIARGDDDSTGPDIGIIILPENNIGTLKSKKIFFNINKRKDELIKNPPDNNMGCWCVLGLLGETEKGLQPKHSFNAVKGYMASFGFAGITNEYQNGDFDYLEFLVDYNFSQELPGSFGGHSGSGVWQVILEKDSSEEIKPVDFILSGMVFYQTLVNNNQRLFEMSWQKKYLFESL